MLVGFLTPRMNSKWDHFISLIVFYFAQHDLILHGFFKLYSILSVVNFTDICTDHPEHQEERNQQQLRSQQQQYEWSPWSTWTSCQITYGHAQRNRRRLCQGQETRRLCKGSSSEYASCTMDINISFSIFSLIIFFLLIPLLLWLFCFVSICRNLPTKLEIHSN